MTADDRYSRLASVEWFAADEIRQRRIAVIGAGAVGNEVVKNLVLLGVGAVDVFDFDRIEVHNLTRSVFFREGDVGESKATVLAKRAGELDPSCVVRGIDGDFWDTLSLRALREYDAALGCVDNFEARIRLSQICRLVGVDLVNVGIDSRYATVESFPFARSGDCACYECHLPESAYARIAERYSCGWLRKRAWQARMVPTTPITASIAGAQGAAAALRLGAPGSVSTRTWLDTVAGTASRAELARAEGCVGCGGAPDRPRLICAKRSLHSIFTAGGARERVELRLSDPVIAGGECTLCGHAVDNKTLLRRASDFDDALMICPRCQSRSVRVEIRDLFFADELASRYSAGRLGAKFVLAESRQGSLCIELEEAPA